MKKNLYITFRALRHRNYLLFFIGQCISLIGTWIQQIAVSWLVYRLTNSALIMGLITFSGTFPSLIISPFAGVFIDRINKHKTLIIVQSVFMINAFILAIMTLAGTIQTWQLVIIIMVIGAANAVDMPLRQSFVIQLVDDHNDLGNAISLNSSMFNLARMIGPAIAGILISLVGEGFCFLIDAFSYIAVITALLAMNIKPEIKHIDKVKNVLSELTEGIKYAFGHPIIKKALLYLAVSSFVGMSFQVLMPIFAKEILHGNAKTLGFLMSASGIGALLGALRLASKVTFHDLDKIILKSAVLFGFSLTALSFIHNFWSSLILLLLTGFGMVTIMAASNTIIQKNVDEDKRGRVMSLYTVAFIGMAPLGSLFQGTIAEHIGVPYTLLINGLIMFILLFLFHSTNFSKMSKKN